MCEPLGQDVQSRVEKIDVASERMLREGWSLAVCLTDLPLCIGQRPVVADASATHGVGLVSLPALGVTQVPRRTREAIVRLWTGWSGRGANPAETGNRLASASGSGSPLAELATPLRHIEPTEGESDVRLGSGAARLSPARRHGARQPPVHRRRCDPARPLTATTRGAGPRPAARAHGRRRRRQAVIGAGRALVGERTRSRPFRRSLLLDDDWKAAADSERT